MSFTFAQLKTAIQDYSDNAETSFVSHLSDFIKGTDTDDRLGPKRAAQSGLLSVNNLKVGVLISFLLSIPALAGASVLSLINMPDKSLDFNLAICLSILFSFIFSYITIKLLLYYLEKFSLKIFVYYRLVLSLLLFIIVYT